MEQVIQHIYDQEKKIFYVVCSPVDRFPAWFRACLILFLIILKFVW